MVPRAYLRVGRGSFPVPASPGSPEPSDCRPLLLRPLPLLVPSLRRRRSPAVRPGRRGGGKSGMLPSRPSPIPFIPYHPVHSHLRRWPDGTAPPPSPFKRARFRREVWLEPCRSLAGLCQRTRGAERRQKPAETRWIGTQASGPAFERPPIAVVGLNGPLRTDRDRWGHLVWSFRGELVV